MGRAPAMAVATVGADLRVRPAGPKAGQEAGDGGFAETHT
jgi:hypothetical protein